MENMDGPRVTHCERCPALVESRSRIVNGVGPEDTDLLIVGEGPGEQEDSEGEPFVGRSGAELDEKLGQFGIAREDVRITNCVRCRPPENRDPTKEELGNCRGYLEHEIELVDPELVMTVGKVPTEHLLKRDVAVTKEAGSVEDCRIGGESRTVLISVHPAAMLYDRSQEATFESTIEEAAALIGAGGNDQSRLDSF
ncbi:uracil-DNA glycosylase [Halalkalicoccus subterraneus]|uniref:uracil-DNA glycosylase n=1 Tax=Halalkalicoccus subterraneus TaxID=2675002 RepID=UPI000EFCE237|nr:uracil-DNA glycosylase [Halalkalicoccus subterraneus]